uniref:Uncharacterized protein n=1 Tax=Anopheles atroparvus TaxID=41427 RepID=A0AAG5CZ72_ANOAO
MRAHVKWMKVRPFMSSHMCVNVYNVSLRISEAEERINKNHCLDEIPHKTRANHAHKHTKPLRVRSQAEPD